MDFTELKSSLSDPKKVYLLEGEDVFFRNTARDMIFDKYLTEPDINLTKFEGANLKGNVAPLVSGLDLCPLLGDYRIIYINEWYPNAQDLKNKELNSFLNSELNGCIVVISNSLKCDNLKKQSAVEVVDCKKAGVDLIVRYAQSVTKKHNVVISRSCVEQICEYSLFDMTKIVNELEKLINFVGDNGVIDAAIVDKIVVKETDYKIYETVSFIAEKNYNKAYEVLSDLASVGDKQILLVSLYNHFRRLLFIGISNRSDKELADLLGVKEYAVKKSRQQASKFTAKRLMKIVNILSDADSSFKSGKTSLSNALDFAVFSILNES